MGFRVQTGVRSLNLTGVACVVLRHLPPTVPVFTQECKTVLDIIFFEQPNKVLEDGLSHCTGFSRSLLEVVEKGYWIGSVINSILDEF